MNTENERNADDMYLSGGVFLSFVLNCVKNKDEEGHNIPIKRNEFILDFKNLLSPRTKLVDYDGIESDISKYLNCSNQGTGKVGFANYCEGDLFDHSLKEQEKYDEVLNRTTLFLDKWIDPDKYKDLVRTILFVLFHDSDADRDLIYRYPNGTEMNKTVLFSKTDFVLPDFFLVIVWLCIIKRSKNNKHGRKTFEQFFYQEDKHHRWEYKDRIGENFINISVTMPQTVNMAVDNPSIDDSIITPESKNGTDALKDKYKKVLTEYDILVQAYERNTRKSSVLYSYYEAASDYYSLKKTLLYAEKPHPFYELYVCNDILFGNRQSRIHYTGAEQTKRIKNATIPILESECKYMIIEGTGGIGKSMFLTHLFLSFKEQESSRTPVFISLKDYIDSETSIVDLALEATRAFVPAVSKDDIVQAAVSGNLILLLDGIDEINTKIRDSFCSAVEQFIKLYPLNTIIITSRPSNSFVSYTRFVVYEIQELSKQQAIELVNKLEFWDIESKTKFLAELKNKLFDSHRQFASNPLLLTIMLMTYSTYGEVPAKMHHFYAQAYKTMARLHDASKGSFVRPLHSGLIPEEFANCFSEFCARTYVDELIEFDENCFTGYMDKVLSRHASKYGKVRSYDCLLDLTENLCIMYQEGEKIFFIHRSFQEYFAALYFSNEYDSKLEQLGPVFEDKKTRFSGDMTFEMLYDMIPEKVERFIFLPLLEKLFSNYKADDEIQEYWNYVEDMYPEVYVEIGSVREYYFNEPSSFLLSELVWLLGNTTSLDMQHYTWPEEVIEFKKREWGEVYSYFMDKKAYQQYPDPNNIDSAVLKDESTEDLEKLPKEYFQYFGTPKIKGYNIVIDVHYLRVYASSYKEIVLAFENKDFPLMQEFAFLKNYYLHLKELSIKAVASNSLFDD